MICPECGAKKSKVYTTRNRDEDNTTVRYRKCTECNNRWKTYESPSYSNWRVKYQKLVEDFEYLAQNHDLDLSVNDGG